MSHNPVLDPVERGRFREPQQLACEAAEHVAAGPDPGATEREAASRIRRDDPATPDVGRRTAHRFPRCGLTFEEALVVTSDGDAFWLDGDLPHVRRWQNGRLTA